MLSIRRTFLSIIFLLALTTPFEAEAASTFTFCNSGDEPLYIVALQDYEGPLGIFSPPSHELAGFYRADPGKCAEIYQEMNYSTLYTLGLRYDSDGNYGFDIYPNESRDDGLIRAKPANVAVCFPIHGNYDHQVTPADLVGCRGQAGYTTLHFDMAYTAEANGNLHYRFDFEPRKSDPVDVVIEPAAAKTSAGINCGPGIC